MAFTEMVDDLDIIAKYPDEPYEEEGFTSAAFKASFDRGAKLCKAALNALVRALNAVTAAASVGFRRTANIPADNVQAAIENVQEQLAGVSQGEIPNGSITGEKMQDAAVTTEKLEDGAVTGGKIAENTITGENIVDGGIGTTQIGDEAVTTGKLDDLAVSTAKIGNLAVTAEKLATDSVTSDKIQAGAVGGTQIADGAILKKHLASSLMAVDVTSAVPVVGATQTAVEPLIPTACTNVRGKFLRFPMFGIVLFMISYDGNVGYNRIQFTGNRYLPISGSIAAVAVGADGTNYNVTYVAKEDGEPKPTWDTGDGLRIYQSGGGASLVLGWYFTEE